MEANIYKKEERINGVAQPIYYELVVKDGDKTWHYKLHPDVYERLKSQIISLTHI